MFGTPASNAAASQPPAPPPAARQTQVFGQPAPAAPAKNQTMMFGTPASREVESLPEAPVEETILEQPGQSTRTMLFGTPLTPPASEPAPAKNQTMMFGRPAAIPKISAGTVELAGIAADEGAPNESTVRVDVAQVIEEHGEPNEGPTAEQPRHDRTQRFAMSDVGNTPSEGSNAVQDRHNRTQLFAMTSQSGDESTAPQGVILGDVEPSSVVLDGSSEATIGFAQGPMDLAATLPPDQPVLSLDSRRQEDPAGVSLLQDPANLTPPEARQAPMEAPVATTLPNLSPINQGRPMAPLNVEFAPEPGGSPADLRAPVAMSAQDDAAAMRAARSGGAGRIVVIVLALVALVLLAVLVYRLFGAQLIGGTPAAQPVGAWLVESVSRLS